MGRKLLVNQPKTFGIKPNILGWVVETPWGVFLKGDYPVSGDKQIYISSPDSKTEEALYKAGSAEIFPPELIGLHKSRLRFKVKSTDYDIQEQPLEKLEKLYTLACGRFMIRDVEGSVVLAAKADVKNKRINVDFAVMFEKIANLPLFIQKFLLNVIKENTNYAVSELTREAFRDIFDMHELYKKAKKELEGFKIVIGYAPEFNYDPLGEEMLPPEAIFAFFEADFCKITDNLDIKRLEESLKTKERMAKEMLKRF